MPGTGLEPVDLSSPAGQPARPTALAAHFRLRTGNRAIDDARLLELRSNSQGTPPAFPCPEQDLNLHAPNGSGFTSYRRRKLWCPEGRAVRCETGV